MKLAAILPLFAAWLGAQTPRPKTARFDGIAVNSVTGEPLSGVQVKLFTPRWTQGQPLAYGAVSRADGRFSMAAIEAGSYQLRAELRGFVYVPAKRSLIAVRPGQHIADFKLPMARLAVIAGRVIDENGDPVANVQVAVVLFIALRS